MTTITVIIAPVDNWQDKINEMLSWSHTVGVLDISFNEDRDLARDHVMDDILDFVFPDSSIAQRFKERFANHNITMIETNQQWILSTFLQSPTPI